MFRVRPSWLQFLFSPLCFTGESISLHKAKEDAMQNEMNQQKSCLGWIAGVFLGGVVLTRLRLLGLPLERDEGEYAYMAQQWLQGVLPYAETHSMKFPGIYFMYASVLALLGQNPSSIHLSLLFVNLATAFLLYRLGSKWWNSSAGIVAGVSYSILTLSPALQGVWANAEHFVLIFVLAGILLLKGAQGQRLFYSGCLLGCALLIKQHALFFCLFGGVYLGARIITRRESLKNLILNMGVFVAGGATPIMFMALLYWVTGNFSDFWFCTIQYASEYVSMTSPSQGFANFKYNFATILESNFSVLWLSLIGMASVAWKTDVRREYLFLFGFFIFSFLAITPGLYFRPHYFLLWMPAFSLFAGVGFASLPDKFASFRVKTIVPVGILILILGLPIWIQKNAFFTLPAFTVTRQVYGLNPFSASLEVAQYINEHSNKEDQIAILGSEPQILFYAQRKSATRHIYMYPLMEKHVYARSMQAEMIREIEGAQPKFIVEVKLFGSWVSSRPDLEPLLKDWAQAYLSRNYFVSGVVDVLSHEETVYKWGEQARDYSPQSSFHLVIYQRLT